MSVTGGVGVTIVVIDIRKYVTVVSREVSAHVPNWEFSDAG